MRTFTARLMWVFGFGGLCVLALVFVPICMKGCLSDAADQQEVALNKLFTGQEVTLAEVYFVFTNPTVTDSTIRTWLARHNLPHHEGVGSKFQELRSSLRNAKIRIVLPNQSDGESSS